MMIVCTYSNSVHRFGNEINLLININILVSDDGFERRKAHFRKDFIQLETTIRYEHSCKFSD